MPKKKKTLKQKMQTDQRRQRDPQVAIVSKTSESTSSTASEAREQRNTTAQGTFTLPTDYSRKHQQTEAPRAAHASTITIATNEYSYLGKDLLKTGFLTIIIVLAELVIKFVFEGR